MRMVSLFALFSLAGICAAAMSAAGASFFLDTGQELTSLQGNLSRDVALGDLDGNGTIDAVVAQGSSGSPEANVVWLNNGAGVFTEAATSLGMGVTHAVALGDLDGDGDLDAWLGNEGDDEIWMNLGGRQGGLPGSFIRARYLPNGATQCLALGDLDGDTDLDALVCAESLVVWWNTGGAEFVPGPTLPVSWAYSLALADLDQDGDLDAVIGGEGALLPNRVFWNEWEADGQFVPGPALAMDGIANGIGIANLDGDTLPDLFFATSGSDQVWWNNGDQTFTAGPALGNENDSDVALADLDGDRDVDALVVRRGIPGAPNGYWLNQGGRAFLPGAEDLGNLNSFAVALADLNADGQPDAFVANSGPNEVYLNSARVGGRPGFFTDSGQRLVARMTGVALGDLDGDGDLDAVTSGFGGSALANIPSEARLWVNQGGRQGGQPAVFVASEQRFDQRESKGVALGDVDGDSDLDIFFANTGRNAVWLNQGGAQAGTAGAFLDSGQELGRFYSEKVALADFDRDGDIDALVANSFARPRLWVNQGRAQGGSEGQFAERVLGEDMDVPDSTDLAVGDLDDDGDVDAVANDGSTVLFSWNQGGLQGGATGAFAGTASTNARVFYLRGMALGDLDRDRDLDLYLAGYFDDTVWFNQGGAQGGVPGKLDDGMQDLAGINSTKVALADLDQDGDLDAFAVGDGDSQVWANDGNGRFTTHLTLGGGPGLGVALGDLDGDGDPDAFVASPRGGRIWLNGEPHRLPVLDYLIDLAPDPRGVPVYNWWGRGNAVVPFVLSQPADAEISVAVQARYSLDGNLSVSPFERLLFPPGSIQATATAWPDRPGGRIGEIWNIYQGIEEIRQDRVRYSMTLSNVTAGVTMTAPTEFLIDFRNPDFVARQCVLDGIDDLTRAAGGGRRLAVPGRAKAGARSSAAEDPLPLAVYRALRDRVLANSPQGQYFIDLYRRVSPDLLQTVSDRAWLLWKAAGVVKTWAPAFAALADGGGAEFTITPDMLAEAQDLLDLLRAVAPPELKQAIRTEEEALNIGAWVGRTMTEALSVVQTRRIPAADTRLHLVGSPDRLTLRWWGEVGVAYRLQQSLDRLDSFAPMGDWQEGTGAHQVLTLPDPGRTRAFYRLEMRDLPASAR